MAKTTPAQILYPAYDDVGQLLPLESQQRIDFHAVIAEAHSVGAEITKYPVQTGFHVSNNSIRQNRVVTLEGIITNHSIDYQGTSQNYGTPVDSSVSVGKLRNYGIKATNRVFQELEELIINGIECRVITNLGEYLPVVFSKFDTKQQEGMVDSMHFKLSGEEIIQVDADTEGGSVPLSFTDLIGAAFDAKLQSLATAGLPVSGCSRLTEATVPIGQNFHIDEVDASGQTVTTSYVYVGIDSTTGEVQYRSKLDEKTVAQAGAYSNASTSTDPCKESGVLKSIKNTAMQATDCFIDQASEIVEDAVVDAIDTAVGKVAGEIRNAFYDTVGFENNTIAALASAGVGCVARSVTGNINSGNYIPGESLPTGQQIFDGAADFITGANKGTVTINQIICGDCGGKSNSEIDESIIPNLFGF